MGTGQGKLPLDVVTDNALRKRKYEKDELEGAQPLMATTTSDGGISYSAGVPIVKSFPDFFPSIIASFVAGSAASQSGTTVTVTSTAHGIVGSSVRNGYRIYYPGSASIPAGWHKEFSWVDANTFTFQRDAAATIASESVNSGSAFTGSATVFSSIVPAGALGTQGRVTVRLRRVDYGVASKVLRLIYGSNNVGYWNASSATNSSFCAMSIYARNTAGVVGGVNSQDGVSGAVYDVPVDTSVDQTVSVTASVGAAGSAVVIDFAELEVVNRG